MWVKMRYVVEKPNKDGTERRYWQRRGFPSRRLRGTDAEQMAEVQRLNEAADAERVVDPGEPLFGTIAWAVAQYRASPKWQKLVVNTRRNYEPFMQSLDELKGRQPVTVLNRGAVREVLSGIDAPGRKVHCAAVLKRILDIAWDHDLIERNPAAQLGLAASGKRDVIWTDQDIERFLAHCTNANHGAAVALHFRLMEFTAQRPGDCRTMLWGAYDGHRLALVQQKTRKFVWLPCPAPLIVILDTARGRATGLAMVAGRHGKQLGEGSLRHAFGVIRGRAGLNHLQARDLRRTAMVRLAEAGCTVPEIAAISGHTIDHTERILEVYLPRTRAMASAAIAKLDEWRK